MNLIATRAKLLLLNGIGRSKARFEQSGSQSPWCILVCLLTVVLSSLTLHDLGAADLRTLSGRYIEVVTDLADSPEQADWTAAVDVAIPLWCDFWNVDQEKIRGWRVTAYVMNDKQVFQQAGLIPAAVPDFPHGFQFGNRVFLLNQPSTYYTRHLLLHEVAHALAFHLFGGAGPAWFMEGTAEYLATHRWDGHQLEFGIIPEGKENFPYWGRIRMLDVRRQKQESLSLVGVMRMKDSPDRYVEPYAWTWSVIQCLTAYPEYRQPLVAAAAMGSDNSIEFTRKFFQTLGPQWNVAQARWRVLIDELDYGYDLGRNRLQISNDDPLWSSKPSGDKLLADQGWQAVGYRFPAGAELTIQVEGEISLGQSERPGQAPRRWRSYPEGITLDYYRNFPLGQVLGCWLPTSSTNAPTTKPLEVFSVGANCRLRAPEESWLLLKVGDNPAELADNTGSFEYELAP